MQIETTRPAPYRVDAPIHSVETIAVDGDVPYRLRHDFTRLDASNFQLLTQHANDTVSVSEQIARGQFRTKNRSIPADANLYKALITGAGWRVATWEPVRDEALIPADAKSIYAVNGNGLWNPGWFEVTKEDAASFAAERQSQAVERLSRCNGEYVPAQGLSIAFMFDKAGMMRIRLSIGDKDNPAYKLLFDMRRPDSKRRIRFTEDLWVAVEHTPQPGKKNDLGKTVSKLDIEQGVSLFDEYFAAPVDDPDHSQIVFGEELNVESPESVRPYQEDDRASFLAMLNPNYKVEVAAAMIQAFSKTDRELQKG